MICMGSCSDFNARCRASSSQQHRQRYLPLKLKDSLAIAGRVVSAASSCVMKLLTSIPDASGRLHSWSTSQPNNLPRCIRHVLPRP